MKRVFVLLVVLLVLSGPALFALDLAVGPKVGGSHNFGYGSDYKDDLDFLGWSQEFKFGITVGAFLEIGLTPAFAIQPEVYYTTSGYKIEDTGDFTAKFIAIDVLLKGRFGAFRVFAGPALYYGVGEWTAETSGLPTTKFDKDDRDALDMRNTHLSAVAGAGGVFDLGPGQLGVEARGTIGLQNFLETGNYIQKNAAVGIMVSYGFPIM